MLKTKMKFSVIALVVGLMATQGLYIAQADAAPVKTTKSRSAKAARSATEKRKVKRETKSPRKSMPTHPPSAPGTGAPNAIASGEPRGTAIEASANRVSMPTSRASETQSATETGAAAGSVAAKMSTAVPQSTKPWAASLDTAYYLKTRQDHDAYTAFTVDLSYKFDKLNSARVLQTATQYTVVPVDEPSFLLDDTTLQYTRLLVEDWNGISWRVRPSATLPVSRYSNRQGVITRPAITTLFGRKFFGGRLSTTYSPFYRYQVNRYKTTISGTPMRRMSLGHTLTLAYEITKDLSASVSGQGQYNWDEQSPYSNTPVRPKGSYLFDASAGYNINDNFVVALGYSQSDSFIREGRYEVNVYDPATARYYFNLTASM